jgi:hypothetical protein
MLQLSVGLCQRHSHSGRSTKEAARSIQLLVRKHKVPSYASPSIFKVCQVADNNSAFVD